MGEKVTSVERVLGACPACVVLAKAIQALVEFLLRYLYSERSRF